MCDYYGYCIVISVDYLPLFRLSGVLVFRGGGQRCGWACPGGRDRVVATGVESFSPGLRSTL